MPSSEILTIPLRLPIMFEIFEDFRNVFKYQNSLI